MAQMASFHASQKSGGEAKSRIIPYPLTEKIAQIAIFNAIPKIFESPKIEEIPLLPQQLKMTRKPDF